MFQDPGFCLLDAGQASSHPFVVTNASVKLFTCPLSCYNPWLRASNLEPGLLTCEKFSKTLSVNFVYSYVLSEIILKVSTKSTDHLLCEILSQTVWQREICLVL